MKMKMKKILSMLAVAAMAFTACTTDITDDVVKNETVEYNVPLEFVAEQEVSRAFMADDVNIQFEEGDEFGVYVTPADANAAKTLNAKFTAVRKNGVLVVSGDVASFATGDKVMAYYPYNTLNNNKEASAVTLQIKEIQVQQTLGQLSCKNMAMVSVATELDSAAGGKLFFRPVASVMKLNIYSSNKEQQADRIRRIKFHSLKYDEKAVGCNYITGNYPNFDLTTVTEDSKISINGANIQRTTTYDAQINYPIYAFVDYNEEGPQIGTSSNDCTPVYIILYPGKYGGNQGDNYTKINIYTENKGRYDIEVKTIYEFGRAMVRPFSINLSEVEPKAGIGVDYIHSHAVKDGTLKDDGKTLANGYTVDQLLNEELIVIGSGTENLNMARAKQTNWNVFDFSQNTRTFYAQTLNGEHGFRIEYYTAGQNILKRGDKIKLNLGSVQWFKAPVGADYEYHATHFSPSNIFKLTPGCEEEIVTKEVHINELKAADLNTDVKLLDMEFLVKDAPYVIGNWSSEGSNIEQFATMMQDKNDDPIYVLISSQCTWKRDIVNGGIQVPQGVGSVHGILVHDEDPSYGNMGDFQLRPFDQTSFDMTTTKENAVNEVAAWRLYKKTVKAGQYGWNGKTAGGHNFNKIAEGDLARQNKMCAETNGSVNTNTALYTTNLTAIWSHTTAQIPAGKYVNHTYHPNLVDGSHGIKTPAWPNVTFPLSGGNKDVAHASQSTALLFAHDVKSYYGWNEDGSWDNTTTGIVAEFPGADKEMSISFSMGSTPISRTEDNNNPVNKQIAYNTRGTTYGFPLYWKVECSIDGGTTWTPCTCAMTGTQQFKMNTTFRWLNGTYALYDPFTGSTTTWKPYTPSEHCPGFIQQKFILPESAIGAAKVMVKISPASLNLAWYGSDWKASIDQGKMCTSTYSHIHALCLEDVVISTAK